MSTVVVGGIGLYAHEYIHRYQCLEAVSGLIPDLFTYMYMYVFKCTVK